MNRSILDGTPSPTLADPGPARALGRAAVRECMSRPAVAVHLAGRTHTRSDAAALCLQVAWIDGLAGLTDRLDWDVDDLRGQPEVGGRHDPLG